MQPNDKITADPVQDRERLDRLACAEANLGVWSQDPLRR